MTSFLSGTLLKEELCCKFMLKHEVKNFFSYFTKTLSVCFKWNTTRTDLVMCNYVWLEQLNDCAKFFQVKVFVLLDKMPKLYKVVQNPRHWLLQYKCYIYINVIFISSPKDGLLKFGKFEFRHVSSFRHVSVFPAWYIFR